MDTDIKEAIEKLTRRMESIEKRLDLLNSDRNILEDITGRLASVEEQLKLTRQHDNEVRKDIKEEINSANERVVAQVETTIEKGVQSFKRGGKKTKTFIDKILRR